MKFDILTIFPKIIEDYAGESILKRGQQSGKIKIAAHDFRCFAVDKHRKVDDSPYGGGPGMILKPEPIYRCLKAIKALHTVILSKAKDPSNRKTRDSSATPQNDKTKIVILDPAGKKFDQKMAHKFSKLDRLVLICGRYEGFDERIYKFVDEKISVGDYVLSGGELGALVITEAVARLVPGVLGNPESLREETHALNSKSEARNPKQIQNSKFKNSKKISDFGFRISDFHYSEYPQYTRPEDFMGLKVPKILLSGNHKKIEEWRRKHS